ncbi:MAG TPA: OsmC family peroxiredoxin [Ktedonobacteraceae bacterium]|nr:OsmC family peroxiredoxin [Ktedonobacteraceae bacterium]
MPQAERRAQVIWEGNLMQGHGTIAQTSSGALTNLPVTWASRTEQPGGKTSPEELIAAAHAECYAMGLAHGLATSGTPAEKLDVEAVCTLELSASGPKIRSMDLTVRGSVPGLDEAAFDKAAQVAEQNCPVSNALRNNVDIRVHAQLLK